jgi:phytoene synthase
MRHCDDLADDAPAGDRASLLQAWRATLKRVASGDTSSYDILPAFHETVERYQIPLDYFEEVINGAEMDLTIRRYRTFEDLYPYCYRVASAVGLTCLKVFGYHDDRALKLGEWCGIALQLTNILRDVREDALQDRIYLPQEDLERFHCSEADLVSPVPTERTRPLLEFEGKRAQQYYEDALPLIELTDRDSQACLSAMICIYHGLLTRMRRRDYDIFTNRISLPTAAKLSLAARCWLNPGGTARREVCTGARE